MVKTVKATYRAGTLALAELLPLPDGETVEVTVTAPAGAERADEAIRATSAGARADLLDCEAFERRYLRATASPPCSGATVSAAASPPASHGIPCSRSLRPNRLRRNLSLELFYRWT